MWTKQTDTENAMAFTQTTVGGRETPTTLPTTSARSDQSPSMPSAPQGASTDSATMQPDGKYYLLRVNCTIQYMQPRLKTVYIYQYNYLSLPSSFSLIPLLTFTGGLVCIPCILLISNEMHLVRRYKSMRNSTCST